MDTSSSNLVVRAVDVAGSLSGTDLDGLELPESSPLPQLVVHYPEHLRIEVPVWAAPLEQASITALLESPVRAELIRRLAGLLHRPARLLPVPASWLRTAARLLGRQSIYERLCGSLRVDASKARTVLGWRPVCTVDAELARTTAWYARQS